MLRKVSERLERLPLATRSTCTSSHADLSLLTALPQRTGAELFRIMAIGSVRILLKLERAADGALGL